MSATKKTKTTSLDVDALTGGFNLQIAWSTGYLAGQAAKEA